FLFVHKPVYSYRKPKEKPDKELLNLINEFKIDAVFSGHEHVFNKNAEESTVYFITGVSGQRPYFSPEEGGYQGFMIIDIKKDSWVYHMINIDGQVVKEKEYDFK
ncbi:MAG: metallophosphoesterase family protein, partial [Nitrososphaeraceae archaeon]